MTDFIIEWIARGGYLGIFLLMALENVIPPIPSEVIMGLGGMAVARGHMALVPLILWGTAGTTVGNLFWYEIGRRMGVARFRPFVERHQRWLTMDWDDVVRLDHFFHKHGHWVIFVFRFLPTFRTVISLPAGMAKMPLWKFLLFTFVGSAIWNTMLAAAGLLLGSHFDQLDRYVGPFAVGTTVLIVLAYVYRVVTWKPSGERS
ncbi:DedA family protein [Sphingomonas dokdonensis]|uniref:Inner membrane protein YqjA n=1 Tax=Sphingomonas dokdonensis TaxID=344880 RepID=A0A245ZVG8_9SPHN|nr:DedA family protein [Sphingomonas dokdonensis]OWK33710.1 inner membrane protein YqjA [Sphingomonas dokdonensis]